MSRAEQLYESWINGNHPDVASECKDDSALAAEVAILLCQEPGDSAATFVNLLKREWWM